MTLNVAVVGLGQQGRAIAKELTDRGHKVTGISNDLVGVARDAANIGCFFKASDKTIPFFNKEKTIADLVVDSYPTWMKMANDSEFSPVSQSSMEVVTRFEEASLPKWINVVEEFEILRGKYPDNEKRAKYQSYTISPEQYAEYQIEKIKSGKNNSIEKRQLSHKEKSTLINNEALPGFDHTVIAMGLGYQNLKSKIDISRNKEALKSLLYPTRGMLLHFSVPKKNKFESNMDEFGSLGLSAVYKVERPTQKKSETDSHMHIVLGGEFAEHVGYEASPSEKESWAKKVVKANNEKWGCNLDLNDSFRLSTNYRPSIEGGTPILEVRKDRSDTNGWCGQGILTSPAIATAVVDRIEDIR